MEHDGKKKSGPPERLSRRKLLELTGASAGLLATGACVSGNDAAATEPPAGAKSGSSKGSVGGPTEQNGTSDGASGSQASANATDVAGAAPEAGAGGAGAPAAQAGDGMSPRPQADESVDPADASDPDGMAPADASDPDGMAPADDANGEPAEEPDPAPTGVPVAIVRVSDIDEAVAKAVMIAGGLDEIHEGQTVFIKPNAVSNRGLATPGIRTSNEVLAAVVRLVKSRNPGRIIVGDRSARGFDSAQVLDTTGMADAAMAAGADEIYAAPEGSREDDHWMLVQTPNYSEVWDSAGGILVMRRAVEADHLINVPTLKNHRFAMFTLSLKNFVGGIADSARNPLHYLEAQPFRPGGPDFEYIGRDIALLNEAFSPLLNIVDGTTAVLNGGPQGDGADTVRVDLGLVLASKDRIAVDTAGVAIIKHELARADVPRPDGSHETLKSQRVWAMPQIENGIELGIGVKGPDEASLVFVDVDPTFADPVESIWRA